MKYFIIALCSLISPAHATTYTVPGSFATIQACANVVNPGDVCRVAAGTYNEAVTVTRDGTLAAPISFIAEGLVTITRPFTLSSADYIRIIGFVFDMNGAYDDVIVLDAADGVEIWGNTFREFTDSAVTTAGVNLFTSGRTTDRNIVIGNTFFGRHNLGDYNHISTWGDDNIMAYNEMNRAGQDYINFYGNRNRFINNYGYDPTANSTLHIDFLQTAANCCGRAGGTDFTLLEGNYYVGAQGTDQHVHNLETAVDYSGNFLSRRNVIHYTGGGGGYDYHHFYIVNDTYSDLQITDSNTNSCIYLARGGNQRVYNSIFAECWGSAVTTPLIVDISPSGFMHDYNMAWDWQNGATMDWRGPLPTEPNIRLANPLFVNHVANHTTHAADDFHLQPGSPAIGTAGAVTTVTAGGSNVSAITVGDAGFFRGFNPNVPQYGGNLAIGDLITIGTQTRRILSISGNVITLATPVTAAVNDPVYMGDDSTPDRGALPYKPTYTITNSLSYSNGVLTATVNDPSLVRHVEFYVDGLPVAVDIEAPYTFNTSAYANGTTHTAKAVARPLYASKVLAYEASANITIGASPYYVRSDGNNANTGLTNTPGGAWRTIDWAADHVAAGDTVRVQAGTYSERVTPGVNGTAGNPITFVTDGSVMMCGWDFSNNNYLRIIGFTMDTDAGTCTRSDVVVTIGGTSTGMEFWNNEIRNAIGTGISQSASGRFHSGIFIGNSIHDIGASGGGGSGMGVVVRGHHNLSAYNELYDLYPDGMVIDGTYSRWLNNYFHGMSEQEGGHPDLYQAGSSALGLANNLIEATFQLGMGNQANEHSAQMSNVGPLQSNAFCGGGACGAMTENIWRRNVWHNVANAAMPGINQNSYAAVSDTRYYHNTTVDANLGCPTCRNDAAWYGPNTPGGFIFNNIHYNAWGTGVSVNINMYTVDGPLVADHNLAYGSGGAAAFIAPWTSQAHPQSNVNPNLVNVAGDDFTLAAGSGDGANARGTGGPLTTTSGSGSGTTFNVAANTGGFFVGSDAANLPQYGGALVPGDTITVGTDIVTIASISGDAITVTSPFTWSNGDPVYFGSSTTPDIGAYPYNAGGYALTANYSQSGGVATVMPSDASLVRFVVCYENGIPTTVDSAAPYTCSIGNGTFEARVYPLYASKTLHVITTDGGGGTPPTAPTITQHPQNQSVLVGNTATFSIAAAGAAPLSYRWQSRPSSTGSFTDIPGATAASYTTPATALNDSGAQFLCVVTNSAGNVTSNAATLTVTSTGATLPPPALTLPNVLPLNADIQLTNAGSYSGATFTWNVNPVVGASGSGRSAALGAPRPVLATSAVPRLSLASMNLSPGPHTITVQASIGAQLSAIASAQVTLVQANLDAVRVYPNPWRSDRHAARSITFDNLTVNTSIKIFSTSGHHIKTLPTANTTVAWDLTNESGDRVASGIYLYVMKADDGSKKTGKIVVVK